MYRPIIACRRSRRKICIHDESSFVYNDHSSGEVLIFAVFAIIVVVAAVLSWWFGAQRRKQIQQLCASRCWWFSQYDRFDIPSTYSHFDCLKKGRDRKASNVLWGSFGGFDFQAFDYQYETGSGKERTTHRLSAVVVKAKYPLKPLSIRPEGLFDRVAGALGFEDIDFEWDAFNRAFYVKAADKQFAYDVINQKTMEFLMETRGWHMDVFADNVLVHKGESTFAIEDYTNALEFVRVFLGLLPGYLEEKLRSQ